MDGRSIDDEVYERLELRGITRKQVATDPLAELAWHEVAVQVIEDELIRRGLNPDTGQPEGE